MLKKKQDCFLIVFTEALFLSKLFMTADSFLGGEYSANYDIPINYDVLCVLSYIGSS